MERQRTSLSAYRADFHNARDNMERYNIDLKAAKRYNFG